MLKYIKNINSNSKRDALLLSFLQEVKRNLETFYVIEQRRQKTLFSLDCWDRIKDREEFSWPNDILKYVYMLKEFNNKLEDVINYQNWYMSDLNNKTRQSLQRREFW